MYEGVYIMALDNLKQCWATPNFVALNQQSPFLCIRIVDKFGSSLSLPAVKFQKILFQKKQKKKKFNWKSGGILATFFWNPA